ncbi:PREDICTED: uncharacterized protein LOC104597881 [Nelumbo nucifera]|uniref:Uncharacterized protein LOC104597881 n=1 Tax=Nelumbo nucifera TaxID=4432 RepID=A0A1U7ZW45_NELNU|nr:PREDICTED: uncharacterized protein LOC104597881 [Nelumbo nucifera]
MGRTVARLSSFCLNRVTTHVRVRSPTIQSKPTINYIKTDQKTEFIDNREKISGDGVKPGTSLISRRIMIVVDSTAEAKSALQWALTHTVQNQDTIVLLCVTKPSKQGEESNPEISPRVHDLLYSMKNVCKTKRPEVQIEVALVEGKDKGPIIVEEAKKQGVSLLVLGQRKRSMTWRLLMMWAGTKVSPGIVEYCIQNASCMTIAVRRKSRKLGGYLITTKRHKDFWLLA